MNLLCTCFSCISSHCLHKWLVTLVAGTARVSMVPSEVLINCCLPMDHNPPLMTWLGMGLHTSGALTKQCFLLVARHCQKFLLFRIYEVSGREEFLQRSKDIFDWVADHIDIVIFHFHLLINVSNIWRDIVLPCRVKCWCEYTRCGLMAGTMPRVVGESGLIRWVFDTIWYCNIADDWNDRKMNIRKCFFHGG